MAPGSRLVESSWPSTGSSSPSTGVEGHRLAQSSSAAWSDLDGLTVLLAPPGLIDGYNLALTAALRRFDVSCNLIHGPPVKPTYLQNYLLGQSDRVLVCAE